MSDGWFRETPESLAMLADERAKLAASESREAVAEAMWSEGKNLAAVSWNTCPKAIREAWLRKADAAIAAYLDALKADGYVIAPARLIEDLTDPDPCQWDHNHSCQAHGHFYIDQGELCPVEEAKRLIAAAEAQR